jgi:hypothetical protein
MAVSTFKPMAQNPLQILAQPQSNDATMAAILAQGATSRPANVADALGKLALLYSANKMNTRANEQDAKRRMASSDFVSQVLSGGVQKPQGDAQASVIANPAAIPPNEPQSASVTPVERSPLPPVNPQESMAGQVPPDGGPALGSLTVEAPGPNDVMPSQPYRVTDAMPPAGHAMALPSGMGNIDGQINQNNSLLGELRRAYAMDANPLFAAEIKRLTGQNDALEKRRDMLFKEGGTQSRHMDDLGIKREKLRLEQAQEERQRMKADRDAETEQRALENQQKMRERTADIVITDIDRALAKLDDDSNYIPETGAIGGFASNYLPGTDAFSVGSLLETVKANAGFDKLQQMREASPTGGALGQVTERELANLQAAIGNLSQYQNEDQLKDNMRRVKNIYLDIIHGEGNGPEREKLSFDESGAQGGGKTTSVQSRNG